MNFMEFVDELEELIETASQVPLTGKVMVDRTDVLGILSDLRNEVPNQIEEASKITKKIGRAHV